MFEKPTELDIIKKFNERDLVPSCDNPIDEIRRLAKCHLAITKRAVAIHNSVCDRTIDDVKIICNLPQDTKEMLKEVVSVLRKQADMFEKPMRVQLRQLPIYNIFMKEVNGMGTIVSAYYASILNAHKCEKPSELLRYCGYAVMTGKREEKMDDGSVKKVTYRCLERGVKGKDRHYNPEIRTRTHQCLDSMRQTLGAPEKKYPRPPGYRVRIETTKYHEIRTKYKAMMQHSARYDRKNNLIYPAPVDVEMGVDPYPRKGGKHFIDSTAGTKAAVQLIADLYLVWRSYEGLDVWPSYHTAKLGYRHGPDGKVIVEKCKLTVEEALAVVGYRGKIPLDGPVMFKEGEDYFFLEQEDYDRLLKKHLATLKK